MKELLPFVFIVGTITLFVGFFVYSIYADKKRRERLQESAEDMGLSFEPGGDGELMTRFSHFSQLGQGRARKMRNLIQGDSGEVKIAIFDYQYTTGSGKNSTTHKMSIASLQSSELRCPSFSMRPQGFFDKIGAAFGFQDIDFDTHPEFSSLFVLQGENEEEVRKFFKPSLLEFFETKTGFSVEAHPEAMIFFHPNRCVKPDELKDLLADAYEVFGAMVDS